MMWLRNRAGTEPTTARSPVRVRRILSLAALVLATVAAVFFVSRAVSTGEEVWAWEAAIAAAVAVIAAVDLLVLRHRRSRRRDGQHQQ
jgi:membrane protein YdbS with pleckstrin-like domain